MNGQMCEAPARARKSNFRDLAGRKFGRLTVISTTGEKAADGCYYWLCRCDCGETTVVSSNKLLQGNTKSCGCYRKERMRESKTYIGGTCLEIVNSETTPKNNTSGVKGVSRSRGRWMVKMSLARRQFFLGRYSDFEVACEVYREAEQIRRSITDDMDVLGDRAPDVLAKRLLELRDEYSSPRSRAAK